MSLIFPKIHPVCEGIPCGEAKIGPFSPDQCPRCWRDMQGQALPESHTVRRMALECSNTGRSAPPPEGTDPRKQYFHCDAGKGVVCKCNCGPNCDRFESDGELVNVESVVTVKEGLVNGPANARFNSSIIRFKGRLLLAYRTGWAGARIHISELTESFKPVGPSATLHHLGTPKSSYGQEDPRLFVFRGRLHVSFTGVESVGGNIRTNVLYARLTDDLRTEEVFLPDYKQRNPWEKNWVFWEWENELFCTYSVSPHTVLHICGVNAYPFASTPNPFPWTGGHLRGGASPVRVGDRFYHVFHGRGGVSDYSVGVNTFEARPPFRILSQTPNPIRTSDSATKPADQYIPVVFPSGAILENDKWIISSGVHDRHTEITTFSKDEIERALGHPKDESFSGDVVLGAIFVDGENPFGVGEGRKPLRDLTRDEWCRWVRAIQWNAERYQTIVLHDRLPYPLAGPKTVSIQANPSLQPYSRRWFAYRDFLQKNPRINTVAFVDISDVILKKRPTDSLWCNAHISSNGTNDWIKDHGSRIGVNLAGSYPNKPVLNCGAWGGQRAVVLPILDELCQRLSEKPGDSATCADMLHFGMILNGMGGVSVFPQNGPMLIHDRTESERFLGV